MVPRVSEQGGACPEEGEGRSKWRRFGLWSTERKLLGKTKETTTKKKRDLQGVRIERTFFGEVDESGRRC